MLHGCCCSFDFNAACCMDVAVHVQHVAWIMLQELIPRIPQQVKVPTNSWKSLDMSFSAGLIINSRKLAISCDIFHHCDVIGDCWQRELIREGKEWEVIRPLQVYLL